MLPKNMARVRRESLNIDTIDREGFQVRPDRVPIVGEEVECIEGTATVVRVLGRVSDGSRLLELRVVEKEGPSFFASSHNVLQATDDLK